MAKLDEAIERCVTSIVEATPKAMRAQKRLMRRWERLSIGGRPFRILGSDGGVKCSRFVGMGPYFSFKLERPVSAHTVVEIAVQTPRAISGAGT